VYTWGGRDVIIVNNRLCCLSYRRGPTICRMQVKPIAAVSVEYNVYFEFLSEYSRSPALRDYALALQIASCEIVRRTQSSTSPPVSPWLLWMNYLNAAEPCGWDGHHSSSAEVCCIIIFQATFRPSLIVAKQSIERSEALFQLN
jgi:hypothetical protein